jgi:hypothetical protein
MIVFAWRCFLAVTVFHLHNLLCKYLSLPHPQVPMKGQLDAIGALRAAAPLVPSEANPGWLTPATDPSTSFLLAVRQSHHRCLRTAF